MISIACVVRGLGSSEFNAHPNKQSLAVTQAMSPEENLGTDRTFNNFQCFSQLSGKWCTTTAAKTCRRHQAGREVADEEVGAAVWRDPGHWAHGGRALRWGARDTADWDKGRTTILENRAGSWERVLRSERTSSPTWMWYCSVILQLRAL